jgi:hypothetical protein
LRPTSNFRVSYDFERVVDTNNLESKVKNKKKEVEIVMIPIDENSFSQRAFLLDTGPAVGEVKNPK